MASRLTWKCLPFHGTKVIVERGAIQTYQKAIRPRPIYAGSAASQQHNRDDHTRSSLLRIHGFLNHSGLVLGGRSRFSAPQEPERAMAGEYVLTADFKATPYWWDLAPRPEITDEAPPAEAEVVIVGAGNRRAFGSAHPRAPGPEAGGARCRGRRPRPPAPATPAISAARSGTSTATWCPSSGARGRPRSAAQRSPPTTSRPP